MEPYLNKVSLSLAKFHLNLVLSICKILSQIYNCINIKKQSQF